MKEESRSLVQLGLPTRVVSSYLPEEGLRQVCLAEAE